MASPAFRKREDPGPGDSSEGRRESAPATSRDPRRSPLGSAVDDEPAPSGGRPRVREHGAAARRILLWTAAILIFAIWVMRDIALLVGYSVLLAYVLLPVVRLLESVGWRGRKMPRPVAASLVVLALVSVLGWVMVTGIPRLAGELGRFITAMPETMTRLVEGARAYGLSHGLGRWINPALDALPVSSTEMITNLGGLLGPWAAGMFGGIGRLIGLLLLPLLAFYLLADSREVRSSLLRFIPEDSRTQVAEIANAVDRALRRYVRGQAIVSLMMGLTVGVALAILELPLVLLLAVIVGLAEVVPFLGFILAAIAVGLAGLSVSPVLALSGVGAYVVINWLIGTFVAPRVMGKYLEMHPFVVTVAVLAGATILGPIGALLALPAVAAIQAAMGELRSPAPAVVEEPSCPPVAAATTV